VKCALCSGRGWILVRGAAAPCPFCGGRARLTWADIARRIDEDPETIGRLLKGRSRRKTCLRVLEKAARWLDDVVAVPEEKKAVEAARDPRQEEMFT